jgi:hypothetical protein
MKSEIIQLILSLTASEKREFKIKNGATSDFVKIFDYVIKYQSLDYADLGVFFEENYPDRKTKFTSGYFSSVLSYLQEKIIDIITQNERKTAYVEYTYRFQRFYALFNRGSIHLANEEFKMCRAIALKYNLIEEQMILNRHQFMMHSFDRYAITTFEELKQLDNDNQTLLKELALQNHLAHVSSQSSLLYYRGLFNAEVMIMLENLSEESPDTKSTSILILHSFSLANKRLFSGNFTEGFEFFEQSMMLWKSKRSYIQLVPPLFLINAQFYLNWLMKTPTGKVENRKSIDDLFVLLTEEKEGFMLKKDVQTCNELLLIIQFWQMREDGKYKEITQQLTNDDIEKYSDEHNKIHFVYQVAFSYFQLGMLKETLLLIEHIIEGNYEFKSNNDVFTKMMMLRILVYKEQNDNKFVTYLIGNAKYLLGKHNLESDYEYLFLAVMKRLIGKRGEKNTNEIIADAQEKLEKIKQNQPDYLMFSSWLKKQV